MEDRICFPLSLPPTPCRNPYAFHVGGARKRGKRRNQLAAWKLGGKIGTGESADETASCRRGDQFGQQQAG
jgi:hypothetical protein